MEYEHGKYFFHYTTREAAFGRILPRKRLRLSPYDRMRDPLENKRWQFAGAYALIPSPKELGDSDYPEPAARRFDRVANALKRDTKLLALTIDADGYEGDAAPFGRGWARARMWEHYAENHAGVCLLFDREKLTAAVHRSLRKQGAVARYEEKVKYTEAGLSAESGVRSPNLDAISKEEIPKAVAKHVEEHWRELFFLKTRDWESEHEYRFVAVVPKRRYVYVSYGDALAAVIVGEQLPFWQRPAAVEACKRADIEALRLAWSTGRPVTMKLRAESPLLEALLRRPKEEPSPDRPTPAERPPAASTDDQLEDDAQREE